MKMFNVKEWNSQNAENPIGWLTFCTVRSRRIDRTAYVSTFNSMFGYEPEVDSDIMAFAEAVRDVCKDNGVFEEKVGEENGKHSFRIMRKKILKEEKKPKYATGFLVEWDDKIKNISFDDETHKLVSLIRERVEKYRITVSDHKVRQNYKNVVHGHGGWDLRDTGGIYFMPNEQDNGEKLIKCEQLFQQFNMGKCDILNFPNDEPHRAVVYDVVSGSVEVEADKLEVDLSQPNKRIAGLETIVEKATDLRDVMTGYGIVCLRALQAQALVDRLTTIIDKTVDKMELLKAKK